MFTVNAKLVFISFMGIVVAGLLTANQYQLSQQVNQLTREVGYTVVTPIPTVSPVVTASLSATVAPVVKTPVRVVTVVPVVTKAVVK